MSARQSCLVALAMVLAMALGGIVHHQTQLSEAPSASGRLIEEMTSKALPESAPFSLVHWLAETEVDPMAATPALQAALSQLGTAALADVAEQWIGLKREHPWSLTERIVHDAIFFRWGEVDPQGFLAFVNQGPSQRTVQAKVVSAAIVRWAARDPYKAFKAARESHHYEGASQGVLRSVEFLGRKCAPALAEHLVSVTDMQDYRNDGAIAAMLADWAEDSPEGVWAWLRGLRRKDLRSSLDRNFFYHWAERDPEAAAAMLMNERPSQRRSYCMTAVAGAWSKRDPEAAKLWAEESGNRVVIENLAFEGLHEVSQADPFGIDAEALSALPRGEQRMAFLRDLVNQASQRDFKKALTLIDSLPEQDRTVLRLKLAYRLFDREETPYTPQEALDFIAQLPAGVERARSTVKLASNLARRDPAALMAWMAENPELLDQERMIEAAAEPWVSTDLEGAQVVLQELPDSPASRKVASAVTRTLLDTDPEAVLDLAEELTDEALAVTVRDSYDTHQASRNPKAFLLEAAKRANMPGKDAVNAGLLGWAQDDVQAAIAWARQQGDRLPNGAFEMLTRKLASSDLESAKAVADAVAKDPSLASDPRSVVITLTNGWAYKEPEAAGDWAMTITDAKLREQAVSNVSSSWSRSDWPAAREWIAALPEGTLRDQAIYGTRWSLIPRNPRLLLEALPLVSSEEVRQKLRQRLFGHWKNQDATAARAAAEEVGLSDEHMNALFGETR